MTDWINENLWVVWLGVATVLAVAELLSLELVLVMFAVAAVAAAALAPFSAPSSRASTTP